MNLPEVCALEVGDVDEECMLLGLTWGQDSNSRRGLITLGCAAEEAGLVPTRRGCQLARFGGSAYIAGCRIRANIRKEEPRLVQVHCVSGHP